MTEPVAVVTEPIENVALPTNEIVDATPVVVQNVPETVTNEQSNVPESVNQSQSEISTNSTSLTTTASSTNYSLIQSPSQRGSASAQRVADEIEADKREARNIIANYILDPFEMLYLLDRWFQQLLREFHDLRDRFKYQLKEIWKKQGLTMNSETDNKIRKRETNIKRMEQALNKILSKSSFDNVNNYLTELDPENLNTEDLKQKFHYIIEEYFQIITSLVYINGELKGNSSHIDSMRAQLNFLRDRQQKSIHTICIIGLEKTDKSAFINALLGFELLLTDTIRSTQIRTVLKPPSSSNPQRFAIATFYSDSEYRILVDRMEQKTDESIEQFQERKQKTKDQYEIMKSKHPERYVDLSQDNDRQENITELQKYIQDEIFVNIIKEIQIHTDRLPGENYELIDVSDFVSPTKEHCDAAIAAIGMADAFLFLRNGQASSLTDLQMKVLNEIKIKHNDALQRAFGIITNLDSCPTSTVYQEYFQNAREELISKGFKPEHIFAVSSALELLPKNSDEHKTTMRNIHNYGELQHGFEQSKIMLNQFIRYELPKIHLKQLIDLGQTKLLSLTSQCVKEANLKDLLPHELRYMSIDELCRLRETEQFDRYFLVERFELTFDRANAWYTNIVTTHRSELINNVKEVFRDQFLKLTDDFMKPKYSIEQIMLNDYDFSKLHLNTHILDDKQRTQLSLRLEKIVDQTSEYLTEYFYDNYICELEKILNEISPEEKDLYRTELSKEQCKYEIHALIVRTCRPVITATLRYSRSDPVLRTEAIRDLIHLAPIVAHSIVNSEESNGEGILQVEIPKLAEELIQSAAPMVGKVIKALFDTKKT